MPITTTQIRTLALLNAGFASEVQSKSSFVLSWAMTYDKATGAPANNSGYSVGTLQSDLGQRPQLVPGLVAAYYTWAGSDASKLIGRTALELTSVLQEQGRLDLVPNANSTDLSKRPLSAGEQSKFNAFLQTTQGREAVWAMDMKQINEKLVPFAERVMQSQTYQSFVNEDDRRYVLTVAMKVYNQSEAYGNSLLSGMNAKAMSLNDIKADILGHKKPYIDSGFADAVKGVDLHTKILNSNTPLSPWLKDLSDQDLSGLGQRLYAADPRFQVLERLFRDTAQGGKFVDSLEQGKPALMLLPRSLQGQARIVGIDNAGRLFSADADGGNFKRFAYGQWTDSFGNYPRSDLPIIKSVNGKMVLALGGEQIELGNTAVAQVNINGTDVTLDANSGSRYAFDVNGDLGSMAQDGNRWVGTVLTGEGKGKTYAYTDFNLDPDGSGIRNASFTDAPSIGQSNNYKMEINDGQGGVTITIVKPIRQNIDGAQVVIGSESSVGKSQAGIVQSRTLTSDSTDPVTAAHTITTDTTLYNSAGAFTSRNATSTVINSVGLQLQKLEIDYNAQGGITQTRLTEQQANGSQTTVARDGLGNTVSTTDVQTFDDGSRLETITLPSGEVTQKSFDPDNQLTGTITDTPDGAGGIDRVATTVVNGKELEITQHANAADLAVDRDNDGDFIDAGDFDSTAIRIGDHVAVYSDLLEDAIDDRYQSASDIIRARGTGELSQDITAGDASNPTGFTPVEGASSQPGQETAWYATDEARRFGATLTEVQSLIAALQSGQPLSIAVTTFNLAASASRSAELGTIAGGLNTLASLEGFRSALKRGDELGALASGASFVKYTLEGVRGVLGSQIDSQFGNLVRANEKALLGNELAQELVGEYKALTAAIDGIAKGLPYLNLINAITKGDEVGVATATLAILAQFEAFAAWAGPVGWAIAAFQIFSSLFDDDTPDIRGDAIFTPNGDGKGVHSVLTAQGGDGGGAQVSSAMDNLLAGLQSVINNQLPEGDWGLIASRLPWLHFAGSESGGGSFTMNWKDGQTGAVHTRYFSADGDYIGASDGAEIASSEDFHKGMGQQFIEIAMGNLQGDAAVVQGWESQTALAQASRGDGLAGLNTEQRARAQGLWLGSNPGDATPGNAGGNGQTSTQTARPIVLDLDGNGISVTTKAQGGSVLVDVDDDGFAEESDWINPRDGILVIDKNGDGRISGGAEMFSDAQVNMAARGLNALQALDADGDNKITGSDFAYNHLRVWQDINHDGVAQSYELASLGAKGISELNIGTGQFVMGGVSRGMQATALSADSAGFITQNLGNSLLLIEETGETSLLATALADYSQSTDAAVRAAHTHASADGVLSAVDELMDGLEDTAIKVSAAQLLDNDRAGLSGALSISTVGNAVGGSVNFEQASGIITFKPTANFNGMASFSYTVTDGLGRSSVATAQVDVAAVNDSPVIANTIYQRAAKWEDMSVTVYYEDTTDSTRQAIAYGLPANSVLGPVLTDTSGLSFVADTGTTPIGFKDGNMYLGTGNVRRAWGSFGGPWEADQWQAVNVQDKNRGTVSASDVETPASGLSYQVVKSTRFGDLAFNEQTGVWSYTNTSGDGLDDAFVVKVTDAGGAASEFKVVIENTDPAPWSFGSGGEGEGFSGTDAFGAAAAAAEAVAAAAAEAAAAVDAAVDAAVATADAAAAAAAADVADSAAANAAAAANDAATAANAAATAASIGDVAAANAAADVAASAALGAAAAADAAVGTPGEQAAKDAAEAAANAATAAREVADAAQGVQEAKEAVEASSPATNDPDPTGPGSNPDVEGTPAEGTPAEGTPAEGTPAEGTPAEGTPAEGTPGEGTPGEGTPGEGTPGEGTPGEGTPGESGPGGETGSETDSETDSETGAETGAEASEGVGEGSGEGSGGGEGEGEGDPIVLDLNHNGFRFIASRDSQAFFDFTGDGIRERTGWTSGLDGLLAYDANSDGAIASRDEIRFKG